MSFNLAKPLPANPSPSEQASLALLQGNILKGHGRHATAHVFLRFDPAQKAAVRSFLRSKLAPQLVSAALQLSNAAKVRAARTAGKAEPKTGHFTTCVLSASGYQALGIALAATPTDPAFRAGIKPRSPALNDPAPATWDGTYQNDVHAMVLIGGDLDKSGGTSKMVDTALAALFAAFPTGISVLGVERGVAYLNGNGDGVEHFGYVDGRSQPLLLEDDIARERDTQDGTSVWDPAFPLGQVLVPDPVGGSDAFGSYFVFRKLEQNVKAFKKAEADLGKKLNALNPDFDREIAGAMLVGRFEDGTPVTLQRGEGMHHPVPNNFDYKSDAVGLRCPFHAHIRKTNPRGDSVALGATLESERSHIMARRGITYGKRVQKKDGSFSGSPGKNVGLLFMAYQSDIGNQFEFTQVAWANNASFLRPGTGIDPVIGQGPAPALTHRAAWGDPAAKTLKQSFEGFVTFKGGEYFFAPSLAFFGGL